MRKIFFAVACLLFTILVSVALFVSLRSGNTEPVVNLETHKTLPASADSDGDGVPNWLEEIHGSDSLNTSSFPYNRDVVQAKKNVENDLLYDGPGDFTEEIVQRFLFDLEGSASVDEEERGRFAAESADYFLKNVEERDLPDIALVVDNTVSRREVLSEFISSLGAFSDEEDPIDVVIFAVLAEEGFEVGMRTGFVPPAIPLCRLFQGGCLVMCTVYTPLF